ncbi:protein NnrT [Roseovarius sp. E0-M6]|uniref:protein NnrT n=1 Tax=Roseovarius sp. E0-M6 TaxID=3127118 RepID=UPI003010013F
MRCLLLLFVFMSAPTLALAKGFDRPIPQAQSATAELWFALSSLALIAALYVVHRMVSRK